MMQDRFKFRIVVFKRHNSDSEWEFDSYIYDNNNWHLTMCGDIASNDCHFAYYRRDNAPDSVHMVYEPELCTGLKDKNGKLIYEGDIVKINTHYNHLVCYDFIYKYESEKGYSLFKIIFDEQNARFGAKRIKYVKWETQHSSLNYVPYNNEVIGNIYENPELLEDK